MSRSGTSTNAAQRGGLSRSADSARRKAMRGQTDDLITQVLGPVSPVFSEVPQGGDMLESIPKPPTASKAAGSVGPTLSALDPPPGKTADWFKKSDREIITRERRDSSKRRESPSLKETLEDVADGLAMTSALANSMAIVTGLPGDPLPVANDEQPDNTYF